MSLETDLQALLVALCPRVFQTVAVGTPSRPYVVWQAIGGKTLRYVDSTAADKRNTLLQVSVWADKPSDARTLIRAIEDALCAAMVCDVQGEALASFDEETKFYGVVQRYSITAPRT